MQPFSDFVERKSQDALVRHIAEMFVDLEIDPEDFVSQYVEGMFSNLAQNIGSRIANSNIGKAAMSKYKTWNDPVQNLDTAVAALNKLGQASGKQIVRGNDGQAGSVNTHLKAIMDQLNLLKQGLAPQQSQQGQFGFMNNPGSASGPAPGVPSTNNRNNVQGSFAFA